MSCKLTECVEIWWCWELGTLEESGVLMNKDQWPHQGRGSFSRPGEDTVGKRIVWNPGKKFCWSDAGGQPVSQWYLASPAFVAVKNTYFCCCLRYTICSSQQPVFKRNHFYDLLFLSDIASYHLLRMILTTILVIEVSKVIKSLCFLMLVLVHVLYFVVCLTVAAGFSTILKIHSINHCCGLGWMYHYLEGLDFYLSET